MLYFSLVPVPLLHPNVHREWSEWSESQTLHVAAAYSNPFRWHTRRKLFHDFRYHMAESPNVVLHAGELAYGDRPFEITEASNPLDVQLRIERHELFYKENVLNAIVARFPSDWKYGACIDGDFHFTRHDWALEAVHLLQHFDFVQLFSTYTDLTGPGYGGHRPMRQTASFAHNYISSGHQLPEGYDNGGWKTRSQYYHPTEGKPTGAKYVGATGGAWAFTRDGFNAVGGMLDCCILGHGDWFMAFGLVSEPAPDMRIANYSSGYQKAIAAWQHNASRLKGNIGCVDGHAMHYFHGSKTRRGYGSRDQILVEHEFDPITDLMRDHQGIYQLNPDKPRLRDAIRRYFVSRTEDNPELGPGEKVLV